MFSLGGLRKLKQAAAAEELSIVQVAPIPRLGDSLDADVRNYIIAESGQHDTAGGRLIHIPHGFLTQTSFLSCHWRTESVCRRPKQGYCRVDVYCSRTIAVLEIS